MPKQYLKIGVNNTSFNLIFNTAADDPVVPPNAPTSFSVTSNSSTTLNLGWTDNSSDETTFLLERSPNGTDTWTTVASLAANTVTYSDTGLSSLTSYYYRLSAVNSGGASSYATTNGTTLDVGALDPPTNLRLSANNGSNVILAWDDNTGGTTYTQVSVNSDGSWYDDFYGNAGIGVTSRYIQYLSPNSLVYYRVRALDGSGGIGIWSDVFSIYTSSYPPSFVRLVGQSPRRVLVAWSDSSTETGYEIRYSVADADDWTNTTLGADTILSILTGLTPSTDYDIEVRSLSAHENSSWVAISASTPAETVPLAPSGLYLVQITYSRLDLHWTRNSDNEDYFEVEYCGDSSGSPDNSWVAAGVTYPEELAKDITGLTASTLYWARVRAVNDAGASSWVVVDSALATPATNNSPTGWEPKLNWTSAQQDIWNQMKIDYDANPSSTTLAVQLYRELKRVADATGTAGGIYGDNGTTATFMYQITGDSAYSDVAIPLLISLSYFVDGYSDNAREYFAEMVNMFDWLYPAMTYLDRKTVIDRFKILAQAELDNFNPVDSDQVTGSAFGAIAMLANSACMLDDPTLDSYLNDSHTGGIDSTTANYTNTRNAVYAYLTRLCSGGEWCESTEYNPRTMSLVLLVWNGLKTATGVDHLPEIAAILPGAARVAISQMTPSLTSSIQWGDSQDVRVSLWADRVSILGSLAGILKGTDEGKWALKAFHDRFISQGYTAEARYMVTRTLYTLDPYEAEADWRTDLNTHFASGQGTYYHHDGWNLNDSLFFNHGEPRPIFVDHQLKSMNNFQLWKNNTWLITHPLGYGDGSAHPQHGEWFAKNQMGIGGLTWFSEHRGSLGNQIGLGSGWAYNGYTSGGIYSGSGSPEPVFCNEHTRFVVYKPSPTKAVDTIVVYDRVDAVPPSSLSTPSQIDSLYGSQLAGYILNSGYGANGLKQWTIHSNVEPDVSGNLMSWDVDANNHIRVETLLPTSISTEVIDESTFLSLNIFESSERKWQARIKPNPVNQWDTFLNVIHAFSGSTPTTPTLLQSSAGQAAEGTLIPISGDNDTVFMFCAIATAREYLFTTGYTFSYTQATATAKVVFFCLDPAKSWTYTLDGGGSTGLTVSAQGTAEITTATATSHTIVLTGT